MNMRSIAENSDASQDPFELEQLLETVARLNPKKILEIGVSTGGGTEALVKAFPNAKVYGLEIDSSHLIFKDFKLIEGDSKDPKTINRVRGLGPFDFIFIDGDHTHAGVQADWDNYHSMVRPGGIVGFHDTRQHGEGWMSKIEVRDFLLELWQSMSYPTAEYWNGPDSPGIALVWL